MTATNYSIFEGKIINPQSLSYPWRHTTYRWFSWQKATKVVIKYFLTLTSAIPFICLLTIWLKVYNFLIESIDFSFKKFKNNKNKSGEFFLNLTLQIRATFFPASFSYAENKLTFCIILKILSRNFVS